MPWNAAQHRLFEAAAHNPAIAKAKGIPQAKAASMASEGIKTTAAPKPAPAPAMRPRGPTGPQGPRGSRMSKSSPQALAKALMSSMKEPM